MAAPPFCPCAARGFARSGEERRPVKLLRLLHFRQSDNLTVFQWAESWSRTRAAALSLTPAQQNYQAAAPVATGREASAHHSLHDPP
jgi:hypothetical protein